jgi:SET domain-containing protein
MTDIFMTSPEEFHWLVGADLCIIAAVSEKSIWIMSKCIMHPGLYVKDVKNKGRGVFTTQPIAKGTLVEKAPVLTIPVKETKHLDHTRLFHYYFKWGKSEKMGAIFLGYGSVYNHSFTPNLESSMDFDDDSASFVALRDIKAGEELLINYLGEPDTKGELWFDVH